MCFWKKILTEKAGKKHARDIKTESEVQKWSITAEQWGSMNDAIAR